MNELTEALARIDAKELEKAAGILLDAYRRDAQVFVVGNGGSAGTANHFVCDFGKNAVAGGRRRFRIHSLCDNVESITALGNDIAFEEIFSFQLENQMRDGDVLIVISASGNSPNLVRACKVAQTRQGHVIVMSGFSGGKICDGAEASLITSMKSYERIEDMHLTLCHLLVCYMKANQQLLQDA